ncbi:MAG: hypothetical protein QF652_08510, partial [Dehalococcoidia bacterium]|nr:hypothetical protein [Dehalococcoidia bacterium]
QIRFIPGNHRVVRSLNANAEFKGRGEKRVFYKAGDVVVLRSEVHTGAQQTPAPRPTTYSRSTRGNG